MRESKFYSQKRGIWKIILLLISILLFTLLVYFAFKSNIGLEEVPFQKDLPVIVIDSFGQKLDPKSVLEENIINGKKMELYTNSKKYDGNFKIYNKDPYKTGSSREKAILDTDIVINARGQSSLSYPKKQYTIRFIQENGLENPQEVLGMAKHDKWVLNGMYSDRSMLRNYLAYQMGRQVMEYSPDTRFVQVYLKTSEELDVKDQYAGIYLLTEKIERGPNRVDIAKNEEKFNDTSFIMSRDKIKSGDIVLQTDWNQLEEEYIIIPKDILKMRTVFSVSYPNKNAITERDKENIVKSLDDFEYSLRSRDFRDEKNGYAKYINVDSFVKFAMINEITKNIDGGEVSSYFYKDLGQKIKAGPVWDFDMSMGNTLIKEVDEPTGFLMLDTIWYERLFQDDFFVSRYKFLYRKYRNTIWSDRNINLMIDNALIELSSAVEENNALWYPENTMEDYILEVEQVREFLLTRLDWMDKNINLIKRITKNVAE